MNAAGDLDARSRPFRALALVLVLYGAGRTTAVWLSAPDVTRVGSAMVLAEPEKPSRPAADRGTPLIFAAPPPPVRSVSTVPRPPARINAQVAGAISGASPAEPPKAAALSPEHLPATLLMPPPPPLADRHLATESMSSDHRWSGSFYAVTRGSGGVGAGPTLGGTQAGVRLYRALGRGVAATASLAGSPGEQGSREATLGVAWRRGQAGVIAERSVPIDGGVAGFRLLAFAGLARSLPAGLRLEGYGQAGVTRIGGFADGAVGIERSIARRRDTEMSVGMGGWASIQRGARRIDIGPQLVARVPVAARRVRVSAEWRMRVAGNAAPNSGPSVTVGIDF